MKIIRLFLFIQFLLLQVASWAQAPGYQKTDGKDVIQFTNKLVVFPNPVTDQITVTGLNKDEYDKLTVQNMQGAPLVQQTINGEYARFDVNSFAEGVYLLVLQSSVTFKEKNVKFIVRK